MNYTHGGIPESEALHWNPETYQQFGRIIYMLTGARAEDRRKGRNDFYEFKRHFMVEEFDKKIAELNNFRAARNFKSIDFLLHEIGDQLVFDRIIKSADETRVDITECFTETMKAKLKYFDPENVEQLSLF